MFQVWTYQNIGIRFRLIRPTMRGLLVIVAVDNEDVINFSQW